MRTFLSTIITANYNHKRLLLVVRNQEKSLLAYIRVQSCVQYLSMGPHSFTKDVDVQITKTVIDTTAISFDQVA